MSSSLYMVFDSYLSGLRKNGVGVESMIDVSLSARFSRASCLISILSDEKFRSEGKESFRKWEIAETMVSLPLNLPEQSKQRLLMYYCSDEFGSFVSSLPSTFPYLLSDLIYCCFLLLGFDESTNFESSLPISVNEAINLVSSFGFFFDERLLSVLFAVSDEFITRKVGTLAVEADSTSSILPNSLLWATQILYPRMLNHILGEDLSFLLATKLNHWSSRNVDLGVDCSHLSFEGLQRVIDISDESLVSSQSLGSLFALINRVSSHILEVLCEKVGIARSEIGFELIRDYPDSLPALHDLRFCFFVCGDKLRSLFVQFTSISLKNRLFLPSVETTTLFDLYISCFNAVSFLESSALPNAISTLGVIFPLLQNLFQTVLRSRSDFIKVLVQSLTEEDGTLSSDLRSRRISGAFSEGSHIEENIASVTLSNVDQSTFDGFSSFVDYLKSEYSYLSEKLAVDPHSLVSLLPDHPLSLCFIPLVAQHSLNSAMSTSSFFNDKLFLYSTKYAGLSLAGMRQVVDATGVTALTSDSYRMTPETWNPLPRSMESLGSALRASFLRADTSSLRLLLSVYGSAEQIASEYRSVLAQRLQMKCAGDFNAESDEATVELMKMQFGESSMEKIEVMTKDFADSRRFLSIFKEHCVRSGWNIVEQMADILIRKVDTSSKELECYEFSGGIVGRTENLVQENTQKMLESGNIDTLIVSHHFWPAFSREKCFIHPTLLAQFDALGRYYHEAKNPRTIELIRSLGSVSVEIFVPSKYWSRINTNALESNPDKSSILATGSPAQISILLLFVEESVISLQLLENFIGTSSQNILSLCSMWLDAGILMPERRVSPVRQIQLREAKKSFAESESKVYNLEFLKSSDSASDNRRRMDITDSDDKSDEEVCLCLGWVTNSFLSSEMADNPSISSLNSTDSSSILEDLLLSSEGGQNGSFSDPKEALDLWESYVTGMLSNLGPSTLDKVHSTLVMFASFGDYPYEKDLSDTMKFLAGLVTAGIIDNSDGTYKLK